MCAMCCKGSIRRSGNRVRVNAQLIDAETDAHIWAERFDYATDDLFALQDEVTSRIAVALNLELVERRGGAADRQIRMRSIICFAGRAALYNQGCDAREICARRSAVRKALALAPGSIDARAFLALALVARVLEQMSDTRAADIERAERLIEQDLAASPRHPLAHFAKGRFCARRSQYEAAIPEYETAIALDRNSVRGARRARTVQVFHRRPRRGYSRAGASDPPQPARSLHCELVLADRHGPSAAIAHRRGDPLDRAGAERQSPAARDRMRGWLPPMR